MRHQFNIKWQTMSESLMCMQFSLLGELHRHSKPKLQTATPFRNSIP